MSQIESTLNIITRVSDANKDIFSLLQLLPKETELNSNRRISQLQAELDGSCKTIENLQFEVLFCISFAYLRQEVLDDYDPI